jgi:tetratricopeptide (TPR) repeat protein
MNALRQEGNLFVSADPRRALELYGQGAAIARQLGNRRGLVELLRGMAAVAELQLLDKEAEQRYREMVQVVQDERVSDKADYLVDLAELLVAEGRFDDADRLLRQMDRGSEEGFGWNLCMGDIERNRGNYGPAERRIEAKVNVARKSEDHFTLSLALAQSFQVHLDRGELRQAGIDAEEIDKIRHFDPRGPYLRSELALARGQWDEAEAQTREAKRRLLGVDWPLTCAVSIVRAEALTGAGRPAEALRALDEIAPALDQSGRDPLKIRARLCRVRAQAVIGSCPGAQYLDIARAAQKLGMPALMRDVERAGELMRLKCGTAVYATRREAR